MDAEKCCMDNWYKPDFRELIDFLSEFKQIYRKVSVDHLDEKKIEEYLQKHGIDAMKDLAPKKIGVGQLKRKTPKRRQNHKVQNQHLEGVLEDYE
ncbi:hypothetical protein ANCCEY_10345 [Ancylostoma ceylanicum]|uniref:Uncharacterized protein n=1 Tax=Ancylostoma ceylanicum TaxID=53326 RepID=A0A0D6LF29_9BILA|nr:hypothetical protein ANCCEY_10345 [Ancylostoma ceylanicum]